ncbi:MULTISPECIES: signal peptidase II [Pseudoalteromonas]|uniref:signal peptidase II n=1 Tax=Pseudoalteromonas TaxID=53246 RepID=UPI000784B95C|nr:MULTISPECIES: signal peptidase II [Gammaproteobacteria]MCF7500499.1 signal peptidase II [Pseudoalteromonas sp. L1]MCF7518536.1 signal peptidase II [Pseudoalteromonas sp. L21]RZF92021.1 lipoprotein signal peptidase [Pseudoalteromonas sp. CO302Y]RZG08058.1 lipoprotein signal peptidase [Pseudoalteromonas sp. CO133X]UJX26617.1 signal peptidase II [Pseudoalteromonas sp. CF6-2]WOC27365.1 signal peptidase II [Pseudoalteromonas sp. N1230-9]
MSKLAGKSGLVWLWLSLLLLVVDHATKTLVVNTMAYKESIDILPFFNFTYVHNYGAAFSFLSDSGGWQRWFFSLIAVSISVLLVWWLKRLPATNKVLCSAYALVLAGAIGNLYDRIAYGYVIDFLHVYYENWHFPVFNIADCAICIGAALLLFDAFTGESPKEQKA